MTKEYSNRSRKSKSAKLNHAFELMREKGLIAKQNFWCCSTCAGYAMSDIAVERSNAGQEITGCCFYHEQDNDDMKNGQDFYLSYGPLDSEEKGQIGLDDKTVGKIVCECLDKADIEYEWNGNGGTRILVKVRSI